MARYKGSQPIAGSFASITEAQLAALNSGITTTKVEDIVDKSNTQTISGAKTFSSPLTVSNTLSVNNTETITSSGTQLQANNSSMDVTVAPAAIQYGGIQFNDKNGLRMGKIETFNTTDASEGYVKLGINSTRYFDGTPSYSSIQLYIDNSKVAHCSLPAQVHGNTFNGTATRALWADLAEKYETDKEYPIGTLVRFGGEKEVTIAKDGICHAVISENPAYLMNSEGQGQPIALAGRVKLRIVGPVKKGQPIYLHDFIEGVGIAVEENSEKIIARALEDSDSNEEKLILCVVHFRL